VTSVASAALERRTRRLLAATLALLLSLLGPVPAGAHPMPESSVWVDTQADGLRLTLRLPLNRLELAFGAPLADAPDSVLARHGDALARYLLLHVGARSGTQGWQALRPQLAVLGHDASAELQAVMTLRAPPGADPRKPTLLIDAVTHEVRTHQVQVLLRNDWAAGFVAAAPLPLGTLRHDHTQLPLSLGPSRSGASLWQLLADGAQHIAEGADHLLFLLMLLLVTPLSLADDAAGRRRRWGAARAPWPALRHTAAVVTAFTAGHSLTLVLGSTGLLQPPAAAVEVAVALTIALAAVHAWRPLFTRADLAMALAFGAVHGLAFSASLSGAGLSMGQHAWALLAFNGGIELMQLALLAAVLPPWLFIARQWPQAAGPLRRAAAAAGLLAAGLWLSERLGAGGWAQGPWRDQAEQAFHGLPLLLWALAVLAWWRRRPAAASAPAA